MYGFDCEYARVSMIHSGSCGETHERLFAVAAWRETPYFSDAEQAAIALDEAASGLAIHGWRRAQTMLARTDEPIVEARAEEGALLEIRVIAKRD